MPSLSPYTYSKQKIGGIIVRNTQAFEHKKVLVIGLAKSGVSVATLLLVGIIFVGETLSVILQVGSFKLTGKRIFKMSPIHHHFEMSGWKEVKIVSVFSAVGLIAGLIVAFVF